MSYINSLTAVGADAISRGAVFSGMPTTSPATLVWVEPLRGAARGQYGWTVRTPTGEYTGTAGPGDAAYGACRRLDAIVAAGTGTAADSAAEDACIAVLQRVATRGGATRATRAAAAREDGGAARTSGGRA